MFEMYHSVIVNRGFCAHVSTYCDLQEKLDGFGLRNFLQQFLLLEVAPYSIAFNSVLSRDR